ncbi:cysteine-rich CWC family protein [Marinomonas flavescens]|uniref:cysteine-rich CWC family protein n=1 Tax=Marinomonas flavescens TaxID=2529379 RepID=UPI0010541D3D|nr:cysteine-rich CWC family protein [Marinomonas flavescens]
MMNCPFCSAANSCNPDGACWCFMEDVPEALLSLLPEALVGRNCICLRCIEQYKSDPKAFATAHKTGV